MAILDQRLFPLLETLVASGLDWLAQEVLIAVLAGHVQEENEAVLATARKLAANFDYNALYARETTIEDEQPRQFTGDEQLDYAVKHVSRRLKDAIDMYSSSITRINWIVGTDPQVSALGMADRKAVIVFADSEGKMEAAPQDIEEAMAGAEALQIALRNWREDMRS